MSDSKKCNLYQCCASLPARVYIYAPWQVFESASVFRRQSESFQARLHQAAPTMKTVFVLLAIAVTYTCGAPFKQLKELKEQADELLKKLPTEQLDSIYVMEIEKKVFNDCKPEFFCQVERVLSGNKKLSQLSEFQKEQGLLRHLSAYNQNHVKNCSVESTGNEITLHLFLQCLNKCVQKKTSQDK
ncbi:hypothetical protein AOLI_G00203250 [Acnodon oligacanthus]